MKKFLLSSLVLGASLSTLAQETILEKLKEVANAIKQEKEKAILQLSNEELELLKTNLSNEIFDEYVLPKKQSFFDIITYKEYSNHIKLKNLIINSAKTIENSYRWLDNQDHLYYDSQDDKENGYIAQQLGFFFSYQEDNIEYFSLLKYYTKCLLGSSFSLYCCSQTGANHISHIAPTLIKNLAAELVNNLPEKLIGATRITSLFIAGCILARSLWMFYKIELLKYDLQGGWFVDKAYKIERKNLIKHIAELKTGWQ